MNRRTKWFSGLLALGTAGILSAVLPACGINDDKDVPLSDDEVLCIYGEGGKDGFGLKEGPILPGDDSSTKTKDDRIVVRGQLSNRFYELSKLPSRDAGAALRRARRAGSR